MPEPKPEVETKDEQVMEQRIGMALKQARDLAVFQLQEEYPQVGKEKLEAYLDGYSEEVFQKGKAWFESELLFEMTMPTISYEYLLQGRIRSTHLFDEPEKVIDEYNTILGELEAQYGPTLEGPYSDVFLRDVLASIRLNFV